VPLVCLGSAHFVQLGVVADIPLGTQWGL